MGYGISFETANGNVQIDSDTTNTGIIVIDSAASATSVTFNPAEVLLFAKPASTSYSNIKVGLRTPSGYGYNSPGTYTFEDPSGNSVAMEYVVAKWSNEQTASSSDYGVQVYNSDGDLAFDSGLYTGDGGIGIISFSGQQDLSGQGSSSTTSRMTTDVSKYAVFNGSFATGNSNSFFGIEYNNSSSTGQGVGIYWLSYITFVGGFFGGGMSTHYVPNFTPRFIAEGGSV